MKRITILLSAISIQLSAFGQGSLTPPSPPAPTMKALDQVEPRTPISSLPYTISQPGSYYLTTNLTGTAGVTNGITIVTNGVTVDLMGFELIGGTGRGITTPALQQNIALRNGTVRNWSSDGVAVYSANGQYQDLRLSNNGGYGLATGNGCTVVNCSALTNTTYGFSVGRGSMVRGCTASGNGQAGIHADTDCVISACAADGNAMLGIAVFAGSTVMGCAAGFNTGDGISVGYGCHVKDNVCRNNVAGGNARGIHAGGTNNCIDSNHVIGNDRGVAVDVAGNLIIRNCASGNATNYVFTGAQTFGPTNNLIGAGGVITNQNPWANFSF